MKKLMLSVIGSLISLQCFANSSTELDSKIYLSPGSVYVAPDAIYINMDGNFIAVECIESDANGIFIRNYEFANGERSFYCARCKTTHTLSEGCRKR